MSNSDNPTMKGDSSRNDESRGSMVDTQYDIVGGLVAAPVIENSRR